MTFAIFVLDKERLGFCIRQTDRQAWYPYLPGGERLSHRLGLVVTLSVRQDDPDVYLVRTVAVLRGERPENTAIKPSANSMAIRYRINNTVSGIHGNYN